MVAEKYRKKVSNYKLADFIGMSEGSIRYMKNNNPKKYEELLQDYEKIHNAKEEEVAKKRIIACVNTKGGVGKSSILNILQPAIKDSIIFNLDFTANADRNVAETVDFSELADGHEVSEILDVLLEEYDTIFVDTPGDISDELIEILDRIDHFIIPTKVGARSIDGFKATCEAIFCGDLIDGKHKVSVIMNAFTDERIKEKEEGELSKYMSELPLSEGLQLKIDFSELKHTNAMLTVENSVKDINELSLKNKIAYKAAKKRFDRLVNDIADFMKLRKINP